MTGYIAAAFLVLVVLQVVTAIAINRLLNYQDELWGEIARLDSAIDILERKVRG